MNIVQKPAVPFLKDGEAPIQLGPLEKPQSFETDSSSFRWTEISSVPHSFSHEEDTVQSPERSCFAFLWH